MADAPVVHIGENSPEWVAYRLLMSIARAEAKETVGSLVVADRQWLLGTYMECLYAVTTPRMPAGT